MLGPQMVVSFQKVMGHLGGTVLLEKVCHWRAGLEVLQSAPLPVCSLPAWGCNVSSPPHAHIANLLPATVGCGSSNREPKQSFFR